MNFLRDLRFGVRVLARNRMFAAAALGVMTLGIGATTAVFAVVRGVLLTPLPYREPQRVVLFRVDFPGYTRQPLLTGEERAALRERTDLFESVDSIFDNEGGLTSPGIMRSVKAASITDTFFETLGVTPRLGRSVSHVDHGSQSMNGVNISYDVWLRDFQGDPQIVGRSIEVNNRPVTVVGVLPRDFRVQLGDGIGVASKVDLWYHDFEGMGMSTYRGHTVIARLRRGVTRDAAQVAVDTLMTTLVTAHPASYRSGKARLLLSTIDQDTVSRVKPALIALAGAVALVLLAACANLTNLLLARASSRTREIAIRSSIGASRVQIGRQLIVEGLVIGLLGVVGGLLLAQWIVDALLSVAPAALPQRDAIVVDRTVAAVAAAIGLITSVLVSLVPAWQATGGSVQLSLKQEPSSSRLTGRTRGMLVASQVAVAIVLLFGAGLMMRALVQLRSTPLGFDPHRAISMRVHLQSDGFGLPRRIEFYRQLSAAVARLPGIERAAIGTPVPLGGAPIIQRYASGPDQPERQAEGIVALPGYLETLGVRMVAGRSFAAGEEERPFVMVDEQIARLLWPQQSALGQHVVLSPSRRPQTAEVIGVVSHIAMRDRRDSGLPQFWLSYSLGTRFDMDLVARGTNPAASVEAMTRTVNELKPGRPVSDIRLLDDYVADATADTRFALFVLGSFALIAVTLTAIGIYGVVTYITVLRTREIAVRLALGADASRIVAIVLREGALWTGSGVVAGLVGARTLSRYLESLLYQVGPNDGPTMVAVVALLTVVALTGSVVPVIRAVHVDPMLSLRSE